MQSEFMQQIRSNLKPTLAVFEKNAPGYINNLLKSCRVSESISIDFILKEDTNVNAFAKGSSGDFKICVYTAVFEHLFLKISKLLTQPNSANELALHDSIKTSKPIEEPSEILAKVIYLAWNYILCHEYSHIILGHLDWLKSQYNLTCLYESGGDAVSDPRIYHALEFQADAFALGLSKGISGVDQYYSGIATVIVHNILADGVVFSHRFASASHPHSSVRLMSLLTFITKSISEDPTYDALRYWLLGAKAATNSLYASGDESAVIPTIKDSSSDFFREVPEEIIGVLKQSVDLGKQMKPLHKIPISF